MNIVVINPDPEHSEESVVIDLLPSDCCLRNTSKLNAKAEFRLRLKRVNIQGFMWALHGCIGRRQLGSE